MAQGYSPLSAAFCENLFLSVISDLGTLVPWIFGALAQVDASVLLKTKSLAFRKMLHKILIRVSFYFRLKMEVKYLRVLSRGLFRSRRAVYLDSRNVLDPNSISTYQKYSEEDHAKVLELVNVHGQNWKHIGQLMGRLVIKHYCYSGKEKHITRYVDCIFQTCPLLSPSIHHDTV